MTSRQPVDIEEELQKAAEELGKAETADDIRQWWKTYYYNLGHRRLGRLILGQPVARLLEQAQRAGGDD